MRLFPADAACYDALFSAVQTVVARTAPGIAMCTFCTSDMLGYFLVLHDTKPLPPSAPWVGEVDWHARGRQHVDHVNAFLKRLSAGEICNT
eukprot:6183928-Pleurochrysis_carterae.AAC.1